MGCLVGCTAICFGLAQVDGIVQHALDDSLPHRGSDADTPWLNICLAQRMFLSESTLVFDRRIDRTLSQYCFLHSMNQPAQPDVLPHVSTSNSQSVTHEHQPAAQIGRLKSDSLTVERAPERRENRKKRSQGNHTRTKRRNERSRTQRT